MLPSKTATLLAFLAFLAAFPAVAKWRPEYANSDPKVQLWYNQQHNERGDWCCDQSDGHPYFDDYTLNADGSVTLHVTPPRTLPAYMVLKGGNPTGHAVWWFAEYNGNHTDYCFAPGSGS